MSGFGQVLRDYPLAVGALGFLGGAVLAASLPSTQLEDEWVGDTRDDLWRQADEAGRDMFNRAQEVAKSAASVAVDAAKEAVTQASGDVQNAAREAIQKTAEGTRQATEQQSLGGDKPSPSQNKI